MDSKNADTSNKDKHCDKCAVKLYHENGEPLEEIVTNPCGCIVHESCQFKYGYYKEKQYSDVCVACCKAIDESEELLKAIAMLKATVVSEKRKALKEIAELKASLAAEQEKVNKLTKELNKNK
ncbi:hypothetical protein Bhyg_00891 [Pseudolycoriella hygida]|uniref:Uncharacterized protein n=1 Tax=Pseudolycoriella hygida TaxID=35572 RepID=A0A9Q0S6B4_9DIPT|nr:hypothetical protein Bhyg_00891 [Pseudolycoriella hygida]